MINHLDMHTEQTSSLECNAVLKSSAKEPYQAPQLKVHGRLERITLDPGLSASDPTNGSGSGTGGLPTTTRP